MIDYLEDQEFRNWVFQRQQGKMVEAEYWEHVVQSNIQAKRAQFVLSALKNHFESGQLSEEEIEKRLEQEIDKYRFGPKDGHNYRFSMVVLWRAAAAVVILVGLFFLIQWMNRPLDVYSTGFGEQMTIELPDNSRVRLNSNSTLTWDRNWERDAERSVVLEGEAFFEVASMNGKKFRVNTDDITINVTGTQFNVNSRRQKTMVYLDEGKVNVEVLKQPNIIYDMEPGDELTYLTETGKVEQRKVQEPELIAGWKQGVLIFRDEPLMQVLESVSDIYGKEFITKDSTLLHRKITTTIPLTNWEVSLTAIQLSMRLEVDEENDTVRLRGL